LSIKNGQLIQYPVEEMRGLRKSEKVYNLKNLVEAPIGHSYELEVEISASEKRQLFLFADKNEKIGLSILIDTINGFLTLDREHSGISFAEKFGYTRTISIAKGMKVVLNLFVDNSVVEVYVNKGQSVLTSRIFPNIDQKYIYANESLSATIWPLQTTNLAN
jgi:beta-fructofuranosidase